MAHATRINHSSPLQRSDNTPKLTPAWLSTLQDPHFWSDGDDRVELIETHISWVFLTRRFAFKLKKPIAFDFLDFRSLEARKQACEDEVRLNRRLAGNIYLGIVPITETARGQIKLNGSGKTIDYVVKMVRLSVQQRLDVRLKQNTLAASDLEPLIRTLSSFYHNAPPLTLRPEEHLSRIEAHVRDNSAALLKLNDTPSRSLAQRATALQLLVLKLFPDLLQDRVRDGRVIEGHGDLRPEHIYLTNPPVIVDCIEFNADFRQLDVADELCFLTMECDTLGHRDTGNQILTRCLATLDDHPSELLLAFYKSYRATVRAKVAALRASQLMPEKRETSLEESRRDLHLAVEYLAPLIPPILIVVGGLMGSGKSTFAAAASEALGFAHLQTDKVRQEMLGSEDPTEEYGKGKYSVAQREKVYRELFQLAEKKLTEGLSVVVDGTFSQRALREETARLAEKYGARRVLVWCRCPTHVAKERIAVRREEGKDASQARPELLDEELLTAELPSLDEQPLELDTTTPWKSELAQLFAYLADKLKGSLIPSKV